MPPLPQFEADLLAVEFLLSEGRQALTEEAGRGPGHVVREGEEVRLADGGEDGVAVLRPSASQHLLQQGSVAVDLQPGLLPPLPQPAHPGLQAAV